MPITPEQLFALFDELGIAYETVVHPPIFTAAEGKAFHHLIPGLDCKNLFLKDKKDQIWLVVMPAEKRASIGTIEKRAGSARLSFGKPDLLMEVLGVPPGSVTPFALANDTAHRCQVILDAEMMVAEKVNYHPLHNEASTCIASADLLKFVRHLGFEPRILDCGEGAEKALATGVI